VPGYGGGADRIAGVPGSPRIAGATVQVPVYLNKASDLANLNFDLSYDGAVAKASGKATKGTLLGSHALFESNLSQVGAAHIGFAGTSGVTGSGVIAYVPFTIVGAPGSHTSLELKDTAANTSTSARPTIALAAGEIVVAGAAPPPTNPPQPTPTTPNPPTPTPTPTPEKTFTALDALKALQMSVGLLAPDMAYDLDKNGQITSNDARLILSRVVGR
jgi:pyruvate/2-oxoglutarate dehydrogenase complex dihydrolipoamide acyltransferase (E2) component